MFLLLLLLTAIFLGELGSSSRVLEENLCAILEARSPSSCYQTIMWKPYECYQWPHLHLHLDPQKDPLHFLWIFYLLWILFFLYESSNFWLLYAAVRNIVLFDGGRFVIVTSSQPSWQRRISLGATRTLWWRSRQDAQLWYDNSYVAHNLDSCDSGLFLTVGKISQ